MTVDEALDKTMSELEGAKETTTEAPKDSKKVSAETEVKSEASGEGESAETPSTPDADAKAPDEGTEKAPDGITPVIEAEIEKALSKAAGQTGSGQQGEDSSQSGAKKSLVQQLIDELRERKSEKRTGPRDITEIDTQNPKAVQEWVKEVVAHTVTEMVSPLAKQNAVREADLELRKLVQDHPDSHKYGKAMAALIKDHPEMPLEYAYRIASFEANKASGKQEAYDSMEKKKAATLVQSTAKKPPEATSRPKNAREAVLRAMEEHGA